MHQMSVRVFCFEVECAVDAWCLKGGGVVQLACQKCIPLIPPDMSSMQKSFYRVLDCEMTVSPSTMCISLHLITSMLGARTL